MLVQLCPVLHWVANVHCTQAPVPVLQWVRPDIVHWVSREQPVWQVFPMQVSVAQSVVWRHCTQREALVLQIVVPVNEEQSELPMHCTHAYDEVLQACPLLELAQSPALRHCTQLMVPVLHCGVAPEQLALLVQAPAARQRFCEQFPLGQSDPCTHCTH